MRSQAGRLQNGPRECHDGALAVCSRHMQHRRQMLLRPAEPVEQAFDAPEREVYDFRVQAGEAIQDCRAIRRHAGPDFPP